MDGMLITSVEIKNDVGSIECASTNLTIDNLSTPPLCEIGIKGIHTYVTLTYNGTAPITDMKNITLTLQTSVNVTNAAGNASMLTRYEFDGVFLIDLNSKANALSVGAVTLTKKADPVNVTTAAPPTVDLFSNQTFLTLNYIHLKYDESTNKQGNSNGGAVAVAVIEGIALIAILAYMGYRTMVKHRMKENTMNAAMYGYDNNSRNSMRMSDIPPPRDPTYATPPTPTVQQLQTPTRNPVLSTPDLVVPPRPASTITPTTPARPTNTTTNGQFNDPFDSLDSW